MLKNPFSIAADNIEKEIISREVYRTKPLTYGNTFLDDATGGIFQNDLILITSKTGVGKTELATQIALANILKDKRVHFFALEAEIYEIERRSKYRMLAECFYIQKNWGDYKKVPNYRNWITGKDEDILKKFEPEVDEVLKQRFKNLFVRYRINNFTAETFQKEVQLIQDETDLIIVDHLHYFDFDDVNENKAMKEAVKTIRDTALLIGKPVVLLAQLRKGGKDSGIIPSLEDVHGSSDVIKIATRAIMIAPARDQKSINPYLYPTYMRITKNRIEGSTTNYVGLIGYDITKNKYAEQYHIGKLTFDESEVELLSEWDYPQWAERPK